MDDAAQHRQAILDAAMAEFLVRGIDSFTVDAVARRAGVDPAVINQSWGDGRVLLIDAVISRGRQLLPTPDTGSLRGDLHALAASLADIPKTPQRQAWFQRMLAAGRDADLSEVRSDYWRVRADDVAPIFHRAAQRGELRDGIDPIEMVRMFTGACLSDPIFTDAPVRPEYVDQLIDVFIRGIAR